jgi:hypothetical protein
VKQRKQRKKRLGVAGPRSAANARLLPKVEWVTCIMCGAQCGSDVWGESHWARVTVDGERFYVCPTEFPPDGAGEEEFEKAGKLVLTKVLSIRVKRIKEQLHNERQA